MADDLRERLLASYAHTGEAMVVQNVLEAGGVPCRVADLEQIPTHMLGMAGGLGRSVGLWVLEMDVERATSLLATLRTTHGVDEEALVAEALAAAAPGLAPTEAEQVVAFARTGPARVRVPPYPWFTRAVSASLVVVAALFALRACR